MSWYSNVEQCEVLAGQNTKIEIVQLRSYFFKLSRFFIFGSTFLTFFRFFPRLYVLNT